MNRNLIIFSGQLAAAARPYYGARIGALSEYHHAVSGEVYAVDSRTLFLKNFNYDGEAPGKFDAIQFDSKQE